MLPWKLDVQNNFKPSERDLRLPNKLLVSAGPTNCSPRVISALGKSSLGVVCDELYQGLPVSDRDYSGRASERTQMMDDIQVMLRYVFQTTNEATLALQNSGGGGIEAALSNVVKPGGKMIVAVGGFWGDRVMEIAKIRNIDVVKIESKVGEVFTCEELEQEIIKHKPMLLFVTHGESSGGTLQPLEGLGDICHKHNCLLAVDAVATLGGTPFFTDRWGIDVVVSASQKAIGAPPGLSLLTFSPKAVHHMRSVNIPSPPFYYNILKLCEVWNCFGTRTRYHRYHYTFNSHMLCALREALIELVEEGLDNAWERHERAAFRFWQGIEKMGLKHFVEKPENRLLTAHLFHIPPEINWNGVIEYLSEKYQAVLGIGLGPSLNKAGQVGMMGYNARPEVVDYVLEILDDGIKFGQSKVE